MILFELAIVSREHGWVIHAMLSDDLKEIEGVWHCPSELRWMTHGDIHDYIGDCYYIDANHWTEKRVKKVHKKMAKLGIRPERLQLEWISAAEGIRFADIMARIEKL